MINYKQLCRVVDSLDRSALIRVAESEANPDGTRRYVFDKDIVTEAGVDWPEFHEGFAAICFYDREEPNPSWPANFIDEQGHLLSDQMFDSVDDFNEGVALVRLNDHANFIDHEGNYVFDEWFDDANSFHDGAAPIQVMGKGWNFIDHDGNILSDEWFRGITWRDDKGFMVDVHGGREWQHIDINGKIIE